MVRTYKNISSLFIALFFLTLACNKENDTVDVPELVGEWWASYYEFDSINILDFYDDCHLSLRRDGSFEEERIWVTAIHSTLGSWHTIADAIVLRNNQISSTRYVQCSLRYQIKPGGLWEDTLSLSGFCDDSLSFNALFLRFP